MERSTIILPESLVLAQYKGQASAGKAASPMSLPPEGLDLDQTLDALEKTLILQALQKTQGNKQRTAALLKINLRSLRYRLLKHGMEAE